MSLFIIHLSIVLFEKTTTHTSELGNFGNFESKTFREGADIAMVFKFIKQLLKGFIIQKQSFLMRLWIREVCSVKLGINVPTIVCKIYFEFTRFHRKS